MKPARAGRSPWRLAATLAVFFVVSPSVSGEVLDKVKNIGGTFVHYKLVLPNGYDSAKAHPAVLAFPGGPQTMTVVQTVLDRNWRAEAERRGYIVVIPAAPDGELFFEEGALRVFPEFLTKLLADFKVAGGKFHIAGTSNGGLSAFHIAAAYPQYFWSVTGFPGYLLDPTAARFRALANLCINMHVGELDPEWLSAMQQQADQFRAKGYTVRFTVEKLQSHRLDTFTGEGAARLFNQFEEARQGCGAK